MGGNYNPTSTSNVGYDRVTEEITHLYACALRYSADPTIRERFLRAVETFDRLIQSKANR